MRKHLAIYFRSLATMFVSGVPLDRALELLSQQQGEPRLAAACRSLSSKVQEGRYLSNAMQSLGSLFTPTQIRLIAVGESTGQLALILHELSQLEERWQEIELKVRSSLTMPLMVCGLCLVMVALAPPLLFQGLFEMLQSQGAQMPWPTQLLIFFSHCLFHPLGWLTLLTSAAVTWKLARSYLARPSGQRRLAVLLDALPVLGPLRRRIALTKFLQSLKTTVTVGLPILQSLPLSAHSAHDILLLEAVDSASAALREGQTLAQALAVSDYFPPTEVQGISAGEESGSLASMLESLANLYRLELDHQLEVMTKALEPLLLSIVGAIVAFTVIAILLPMLKVMESL